MRRRRTTMKVDVFGIEYVVQTVTDEQIKAIMGEQAKDYEFVLGAHDCRGQRILILDEIEGENKLRVFTHELVHAVAYVLGNELIREEAACDFIGAHLDYLGHQKYRYKKFLESETPKGVDNK